MIYDAVRRLLFQAPPERIHTLAFGALRTATATGVTRRGLRRALAPRDPILASTVFGVRFPGPLGLAAGFDKDGLGLDTWGALGFGYAEIGTVTAQPQPGNPSRGCSGCPRTADCSTGWASITPAPDNWHCDWPATIPTFRSG